MRDTDLPEVNKTARSNYMKRVVFCLPLIVAGAALGTSTSVLANDFPTDARVQFVFECMHDHGGASYANLYHCSCTIDRIADAMPIPTSAAAMRRASVAESCARAISPPTCVPC